MLSLSAAIKHTLMALLLRHVSIAHLTMLRVLSRPHEPRQYLAQHFHVPRLVFSTTPHATPNAILPSLVKHTEKSMTHMEK